MSSPTSGILSSASASKVKINTRPSSPGQQVSKNEIIVNESRAIKKAWRGIQRGELLLVPIINNNIMVMIVRMPI